MEERQAKWEARLEKATGGARMMTLSQFARYLGKDRRTAAGMVGSLDKYPIGRTINYDVEDLARVLAGLPKVDSILEAGER